ncbi:MAG: type II and III secretion system protein [Elusimicrobia bacterium]|nr:type II and III secretion system protein [Elusimicrobiota bacterium]
MTRLATATAGVLFFLTPAFISAGDEMIQITVEVTEINNNKARELGIKWLDNVQFGEVSWSADSRAPEFLPEIPALLSAGDFARWTALQGDIKMLQRKGAAKILSKPKLITRSGTEAEFKVGGEFPVVASGVGGGSIEWKEYGIILKIKPEVVGDKKVRAEIITEISRLDWANQVQNVPALSSRESRNNVTIKSGETITVAGLTETKSETTKTGIPLLSDLPILGYLFGQESVTEVQNTVLIFITPEIVK